VPQVQRERRAARARPTAAKPPVLLTMAGYSGTLAAVRCLGQAGIAVTVASDHAGLPAAWSRWTSRRVRCPDSRDPERFMAWLLDFGSRQPGHVLYPTSDDLAFLFARHAADLSDFFRLYQPPVETIVALLDKRSLAAAARAAGLETPVTYFAADDAELERIAQEAHFPLLVKPRTQMLFPTRSKGTQVRRREELLRTYRAYARANRYLEPLLAEQPDIARPMLQEYYPEAEENIHSVAGFIDETGVRFVARASRKVLQRPRRLGVGVCFEDAAPDPVESRGIAALCRATGYFGVFEAEFIRIGDRRLLIDFNPRYYNQMAFEIARGLPLPLLSYAGAVGDVVGLDRMVREAEGAQHHEGSAWCHRSIFAILVMAQRLSGRASVEDARRWRRWRAEHRGRIVDAGFQGGDILPGLIDIAIQLWAPLRHPRAFFRSIVMNR